MGTRYLEAISDQAAGSSWSIGGGAGHTTFWESLDLVTTTLPPTASSSDAAVSYSLISNSSLPGTAPAYLRVRVFNGAAVSAPLKRTGVRIGAIWVKAGAGHFLDLGGLVYDWPSVELFNNGVSVAGPFTSPEQAAGAYAISYFDVDPNDVDLIDWTQPIDLQVNNPQKGTGSVGCRISALWLEAPDPYSLQADGGSQTTAEVDGFFTNLSARGGSQTVANVAGSQVFFEAVVDGGSQTIATVDMLSTNISGRGGSQTIATVAGLNTRVIVDGGSQTIATVVGALDEVFPEIDGGSQTIATVAGFVTYPPLLELGYSPAARIIGRGR